MSALHSLLQNPAIWRGDEPARVALPGIPTGFAALDAELPGGGWPRGMVGELLTERHGIGELSLLMPALARLSQQEGWLVLVAPPWIPYAPALAAHGVRLSRLIVASTASDRDTWWAAEQSLRAGNCPAVLAWPSAISEQGLRRLQLAAEEGGSFGVVFGEAVRAVIPSPAPLRLRLGVHRDRLSVTILKRRGSGRTPTLWLDADPSRASLPVQVLNHGGHGEHGEHGARQNHAMTAIA
ncbi:MAG TPA: translesion DNA synthesis-associated protein ImuA [Burkholderiales bacterium]|nr:translesion DNA synthesis-associated protein ImuA [Burkholderiales bacterium]